MRTDTKDLLPCPFCGSTDAVRLDDGDSWDFLPDGEPVTWAVVCDYNRGGCGGSGGFRDSRKDAIAAWNQAADRLAEVEAELASLRTDRDGAAEACRMLQEDKARLEQDNARLRGLLAVAQAELSADAQWQAVIDQIADDEDRMHEQIELWARQSYRRSRSGIRGTTITRGDSEVTHYVWAALRWAHEREQAEVRELRAKLARVREIVSGMREALEDIRSRSSIDFFAMRSGPFELTARLGDIHQIADAALEQEDTQ